MLCIVSIKDMKAGLFFPPTTTRTTVEASRSFAKVSAEPNTIFASHPHDFRLFHLANFDDLTGEIHILKHPADLGSSADHLPHSPQTTLPFPSDSRSN